MAAIPTLRVRMLATGDVVTINEQDFDGSRHAFLLSVAEVGDKAAISLVEAAQAAQVLDRFEAAEQAHRKHAGGRVSVIRAISERRAALKALEGLE